MSLWWKTLVVFIVRHLSPLVLGSETDCLSLPWSSSKSEDLRSRGDDAVKRMNEFSSGRIKDCDRNKYFLHSVLERDYYVYGRRMVKHEKARRLAEGGDVMKIT